jgi:hypothetical protein
MLGKQTKNNTSSIFDPGSIKSKVDFDYQVRKTKF